MDIASPMYGLAGHRSSPCSRSQNLLLEVYFQPHHEAIDLPHIRDQRLNRWSRKPPSHLCPGTPASATVADPLNGRVVGHSYEAPGLGPGSRPASVEAFPRESFERGRAN